MKLFRSHTLALKAIESGYFDDQIVPITIKERRKEVVFSKDEHPRADITAEKLAGLKPAFRKDGSVTGNASGLNDGSAVLVLMSEEKRKERFTTVS